MSNETTEGKETVKLDRVLAVGTSELLTLEDLTQELDRRGNLLNEIADAVGYDRSIWQIATCNALAHNIRDLGKNYNSLSMENLLLKRKCIALMAAGDKFLDGPFSEKTWHEQTEAWGRIKGLEG